MRILHVAQPTTEGTAAVVLQLATAAAKAGHAVTVATPDGPGLPELLSQRNMNWIPLEMTRTLSSRDLRAVAKLRGMLPHYDVVHLHSSKAGAVGRVATLFHSRRPAIVFTPHGWSWYVGGRMANVYRAFERWAAGRTDAVVTVSKEEMEDGVEILGAGAASSRTLRLIQNGIDTNVFVPAEVSRERGLIVCVGRLSKQKGQDRLIRALTMLPSGRAIFLGDGPERARLVDLAKSLGVYERVEFVGNRPPLPYLQRAEVVAIPSRWEGLSIAMLEAMSAGCLIVHTRFGGADALSGAGILADGPTEEEIVVSMAGCLQRAISAGDEMDHFRLESRRAAVERFSVDRVNREYEDLWLECVSSRNRRPRSSMFGRAGRAGRWVKGRSNGSGGCHS